MTVAQRVWMVWKDEEGSMGVRLVLFQPELLRQGLLPLSPPAVRVLDREPLAGTPGTAGARFQTHALSPMPQY